MPFIMIWGGVGRRGGLQELQMDDYFFSWGKYDN